MNFDRRDVLVIRCIGLRLRLYKLAEKMRVNREHVRVNWLDRAPYRCAIEPLAETTVTTNVSDKLRRSFPTASTCLIDT